MSPAAISTPEEAWDIVRHNRLTHDGNSDTIPIATVRATVTVCAQQRRCFTIPFPPRMMMTTVDETPIRVWMLHFKTLCNDIQLILCGLLHCDPSHCFYLCCFTVLRLPTMMIITIIIMIIALPQLSNASTSPMDSTAIEPSHLYLWSSQYTNVPSHHTIAQLF